MKDVAVVIVNWNTAGLLRDCLTRLDTPRNAAWLHVIVIDNASTDDSLAMLQTEFPLVTAIANEANLGFGRANNIGIAKADARYIVFMNSDTLASPATLRHLMHYMDAHHQVGIVSPLLRTKDGRPQPHAFGDDPTIGYLLRRGASVILFKRHLHDWNVKSEIVVDWVSGACLMIRREALQAIGGFDDHIFMYFEDNDLCLRARNAGWLVVYDGTSEITHLGGSSARHNPAAQEAYQQSLRYFHQKHYGSLSTQLLNALLPFYTRMSR